MGLFWDICKAIFSYDFWKSVRESVHPHGQSRVKELTIGVALVLSNRNCCEHRLQRLNQVCTTLCSSRSCAEEPMWKKAGSKNCDGLPLSRTDFGTSRAIQKACSSPHHVLPALFPRKCLYWVLPISLPSKMLFHDALDKLWTNITCTALPQPGIRLCKNCTGIKHIQLLFHSCCWSCASVLAAENSRFGFSQLKCSHNPTKLMSVCLDIRMCHWSYQRVSCCPWEELLSDGTALSRGGTWPLAHTSRGCCSFSSLQYEE